MNAIRYLAKLLGVMDRLKALEADYSEALRLGRELADAAAAMQALEANAVESRRATAALWAALAAFREFETKEGQR